MFVCWVWLYGCMCELIVAHFMSVWHCRQVGFPIWLLKETDCMYGWAKRELVYISLLYI